MYFKHRIKVFYCLLFLSYTVIFDFITINDTKCLEFILYWLCYKINRPTTLKIFQHTRLQLVRVFTVTRNDFYVIF